MVTARSAARYACCFPCCLAASCCRATKCPAGSVGYPACRTSGGCPPFPARLVLLRQQRPQQTNLKPLHPRSCSHSPHPCCHVHKPCHTLPHRYAFEALSSNEFHGATGFRFTAFHQVGHVCACSHMLACACMAASGPLWCAAHVGMVCCARLPCSHPYMARSSLLTHLFSSISSPRSPGRHPTRSPTWMSRGTRSSRPSALRLTSTGGTWPCCACCAQFSSPPPSCCSGTRAACEGWLAQVAAQYVCICAWGPCS